ncbi:rod shape-determining protein MreC [Microbispora sp. NEAU-D428]|uniref:rod shape-determining protein MreC n=1 Tax=Microbispora sitophila TaxID=2771537 RepID=UPI001867D81A|nr:rod shape-determining protein MreC [Microbispora sitophila]MBE3014586.1 rod shape-determining protein MreC [Microbispora sitophila]
MRAAGRRAPALLALVSAALIVADTVTPLGPLRAFGAAVYGGLEDAASAGVRWVSGERRLEELERENARLRADLLAARGTTPSPAQADGYRAVPAHVIGFGRDGTVTVDTGADAGVARDMTVFDGNGLVGRVLRAGPGTATVQLATASGASIGARLEGSREVGLVTGVPERGLLRLSLLNPSAEVKPGDRVVTLGSRDMRPYVPDVPIGTVVTAEPAPDALTRTALVRPFARFTALDLVTVVLGPQPDGTATDASADGSTAKAGDENRNADRDEDRAADRDEGGSKKAKGA